MWKEIIHEDPTTEAWEPSDTWALWFIKEKLGLLFRRITGDAAPPGAEDEQRRLHRLNIMILSVLLTQGVIQPGDVYFKDEFGECLCRSSTGIVAHEPT